MSETVQRPAKQFRGFDLSAYELSMNVFHRGATRLVAISGNVTDEVRQKITEVGFVRLPWGTYAMSRQTSPSFWSDMRQRFPLSNLVVDGGVCADGSIMRKENFLRDLSNPAIIRQYGNPIDGTPPTVEATSDAPVVAAPAAPAPVVDTPPSAPEVQAPSPAVEVPSTVVERPAAPARAPIIRTPTLDTATLSAANRTLDTSIQNQINVFELNEQEIAAGVVKRIPDGEQASSYALVVNKSNSIGYVPLGNLQSLRTLGVSSSTRLFVSSINGVRFSQLSEGIVKIENLREPEDPINRYDFLRNMPDYEKLSFIAKEYTARIIEQGAIPQAHADNMIRILWELGTGEIPAEIRKTFTDFVGMSTYVFLNRSRNGRRNVDYRKLSQFASLDRTSRENREAGHISPQIAYGISRSVNFESMAANWQGIVVNDHDCTLIGALPTLMENKIHIEVPNGRAKIMNHFLPIGLSNVTLSDDPIEPNGQHMQVVNLMGASTSEITMMTLNEEQVPMRGDQADVISYVESRAPDGQSTFILDGKAEDHQNLIDYLKSNYRINGIGSILGSYASRVPGHTDILVLSLSNKRPQPLDLSLVPESENEVHIIDNDNDMWSWSSSVISQRAQIMEALKSEGNDDIDRNMSDATANTFQEPYGAMSRLGSPKTMIPKYHAVPIRRFQNKIWKQIQEMGFENVDTFVSHLLGMSEDELKEVLSPEQIDMAAITRIRLNQPREDGNAIMIADNTGVGKTRENAAFTKMSLMEEKLVTYFTEYSATFGAIYFEFDKLKVNDIARYMTLNHKDILDKKTKEVIVEATPRHIVRGLTTRMLTPNCNIKMTSLLLSHKACTALKAQFKEALHNLPSMNEEELERYERLKALMSKFQGNQITLINDESIEDVLSFVAEDQIRGTFVDFPNYNVVLSSYSQVNRPTHQQQADKGRISMVDYMERLAKGEKFSKKPKFIVHNPKSTWMTEVVAKMPNLSTVLDESHIAASDNSNMSQNVDAFVQHADYVAYASATWLKGVNGMKLYRRAFSHEMPIETISSLMKHGDETIHETLTRMMVETGAYIRRELDTSGCIYNTVTDKKYFWENVAMVNAISPVMSAIGVLSGEISARVSLLNETLEGEALINQVSSGANSVRSGRSVFDTSSIGSPMTRIESTINLIYLHKMVVDQAIEHLKEGRKPFITVNGTNEAYVKNFYDKYGRTPNLRDLLRNLARRCTKILHRGEAVDFSGQVVDIDIAEDIAEKFLSSLPEAFSNLTVDDIEVSKLEEKKNAIMAVLNESGHDSIEAYIDDMLSDIAIELQTSEKYIESENEISFISAISMVRHAISLPIGVDFVRMDIILDRINTLKNRLPSNPGKSLKTIMDLIETVPEAPVSLIDEVRNGIEAAGFSCGEITGRRFQFIDGKPVQREITAKDEIRDLYNNGGYKAVIVNQSAASSLDMHAAEDVLDQGTRVTQFFGTQPDGVTFGQLAGRTNRNGQISMPWYESYSTGMAITRREQAILFSKLRSMYALSTSNRDNSLITEETIDIMNPVGDDVCFKYLKDRPELALKLGLAEKLKSAISSDAEGRSTRGIIDARKVSRCVDMYLPFHEQNKVIKEIEIEYTARIEELNALGENPLKPQEIRGESSILSKKLVSGFETTTDQSIFNQPVYEATISTVEAFVPVEIDTIVSMVEQTVRNTHETPAQRAELLWERRDEILYDEKGLDKAVHVDDYYNGTSEHIAPVALKVAYKNLQRLCEGLKGLELGSILSDAAHFDGYVGTGNTTANKVNGLITKIKMPEPDSNDAFSANHYEIEVISPTLSKPEKVRLSIMMRQYERNKIMIAGADKEAVHLAQRNSGLNSDVPEEFMSLYRQACLNAESNARRKYSTVLIGNELMATAMVLEHKFGNPVVFHTETGPVRGILVHDMDKYNGIAVNVETPELASAILNHEDVRRIEFDTKPTVILTRLKGKKDEDPTYKISIPSSDAAPNFYEDENIVQFAEAHYGSIENMVENNTASDRVKTKIVLKVEDENMVYDFIQAMFSSRQRCVLPKVPKTVVATIRQELMNEGPERVDEANEMEENNTPEPPAPGV